MSKFKALVHEAVSRRQVATAREMLAEDASLEAASALEVLAEAASCFEAASALMSITELQYLIQEKGGYDSKCIMIKTLFQTDVDKAQNRLSMPLKQISDDDFLNQDEKTILNGSTENGVVVGFIGPRCEETTMVLKKRNFTRSSSYVLIENWHKIAMKNGLKKGDTVQVWFFRVDNRPWFALVKPANLNHI